MPNFGIPKFGIPNFWIPNLGPHIFGSQISVYTVQFCAAGENFKMYNEFIQCNLQTKFSRCIMSLYSAICVARRFYRCVMKCNFAPQAKILGCIMSLYSAILRRRRFFFRCIMSLYSAILRRRRKFLVYTEFIQCNFASQTIFLGV